MGVMQTPEHSEMMVARITAMGSAQRTTIDHDNNNNFRARDFKTRDFDGFASAWGKLSFGVKVMVKGQCSEVHDMLLEAARMHVP